MITILICAGMTDAECNALLDTIEILKMNDKVEFLFENPKVCRSDKRIYKIYRRLKRDPRFFSFNCPCYELRKGSIFQYVSESMDRHMFRHNNMASIYLAGITAEIHDSIVRNYHLGLNFPIKIFTNSDRGFNWEIFEHEEDSLSIHGAEAQQLHHDEQISLKQLSPPDKRRKNGLIFIGAACVMTAAALVLLTLKPEPELPPLSEESTASVNIEELLQKAKDILQQYSIENIPYEDAVRQLSSLELQDEKISQLLSDADMLRQSKEAYQSGKQALADENYKEAFAFFNQVTEKDINYKAAQSDAELALLKYKLREKDTAEGEALLQNYSEAFRILGALAEEFPEDSVLVAECGEKQKKYIGDWIELQRQQGNYFHENGAVILSYSYQYFDMPYGIDALLEEAYQHEREQLIELLNQKRAMLEYEPMYGNDRLTLHAQANAQLMREGRDDEMYSEYNINFLTAANADAAMDHYVRLEGLGEFAANTRSIGVGIQFKEEEMTCVWVILTASETDI